MGEYRRYNPINFDPQNFMRPRTNVVWPELKYLNRHLASLIEGTMRVDQGSLLIGTEFEVLFFDANSDPFKTWNRFYESEQNPNYQRGHLDKVERIAELASKLDNRHSDMFEKCADESNLMIEFRTTPQNIKGYYDSVSYFANWLRRLSKKYGVLPVTHSQHLHISSNRKGFPSIDKDRKNGRLILCGNFDAEIIDVAFSRILPLVLLPEEYDHCIWIPPASHTKGPDWDHVHPEFRLLSSEYMNDPVLNLTVSLRALYASMYNPEVVTKTRKFRTYREAVRGMEKDQELASFFGPATLATLSNIASQYPAVSRRIISLNEVKTLPSPSRR